MASSLIQFLCKKRVRAVLSLYAIYPLFIEHPASFLYIGFYYPNYLGIR